MVLSGDKMRKALVVGINNYPSAELKGCIYDATRISTVLEKNGDGSPNFDVKLMTDPLDKTTLKKAIEELFATPSDVALIYFSGHGALTSTGGYIVTRDSKRYDEGIPMDQILLLANNSTATNKIIILDCCYSGAFGSPESSDSNLSQLGEGVTVLTASRKYESAVEIDGSGVFTSLLIDALQGTAADIQGRITTASVYAYVDSALGAWDQRPIFKTNISKFIPLRNVNPKISLEILRKITDYFPEAEDEFKLNPTYEDTEECKIDENCQIFKHLQKYESEGLVKPVGEEHMYYAAINSKSCKLTASGYHYWMLIKDNKI